MLPAIRLPLPRLIALVTMLPLAPAPASAQHPPSQVELNGFVLGQHRAVMEKTFGKPWREQTTSDHWVYRTYIIDRPHHAYMAFKFASQRKDYCYSIQVAGDSGTPMVPFLGLRLGDRRRRIDELVGPPSKTEREKQWPADLLSYHGRNYSFETDTLGRLSSIEIFGYEGFRERPDSSAMNPLPALERALAERGVDSLILALAPDFELYHGGNVLRYTVAARDELADSASALTTLLYGPGSSLRAALAEEKTAPDVALRVSEKAPLGLVYKFAKSRTVEEVVFQWQAGRWKVWEVRLR